MRGPYPGELRMRVIHFVEGGGSRREAAEEFEVSASSAIRCNAFAKTGFECHMRLSVNRRPNGTPDRHPKGTPSFYVLTD